jgi:YVTN family beta-propeller protein
MATNAKQKLFHQNFLSISEMKQYTYLLFILTIFSCKSDDNQQDPIPLKESKVLILNEGNYNFGNASLSLYNDIDQSVNNKIFQSNNQGRPIGDVVQSALQIGNELFVVVNNSSKIEILNASTLNSIGSIQQLNSPRYMVAAHSQKAYVSDIYEDKLHVINPTSHNLVKTIDTKGWVEEMAIVNSKLYLTHVDSNEVWILDVVTDSVLKKIKLHEQPQFIEVDKNSNVWISCGGGFNGGKSALYHVQTSNDSVLSIFEGVGDYKIGELEMNSSKLELHFLGKDGLYVIDISSNVLPSAPKVPKGSRLFYGFSINPVNDEIYISDAIDYQQNGVVYRFNYSGVQLDAFKVGIIPGDILFLD